MAQTLLNVIVLLLSVDRLKIRFLLLSFHGFNKVWSFVQTVLFANQVSFRIVDTHTIPNCKMSVCSLKLASCTIITDCTSPKWRHCRWPNVPLRKRCAVLFFSHCFNTSQKRWVSSEHFLNAAAVRLSTSDLVSHPAKEQLGLDPN